MPDEHERIARDGLPAYQPVNVVNRMMEDDALAEASARLQRSIERIFRRSLHIRHVDSGSCNACESEIKLLTSPYYDIHRLGIFFTPSPRHADLLLVTGPVTHAMRGPLLRTYDAMPDPRLVVGVGACASGGGVFGPSAYVRGGLEGLLPVDVYIPGCPPTPMALIYGLLLAVNRVEQRAHGATSEMAVRCHQCGLPAPGASHKRKRRSSGERMAMAEQRSERSS